LADTEYLRYAQLGAFDAAMMHLDQAGPEALNPKPYTLNPGPDTCCSPRDRMPFHSTNVGSKRVSMTWQAKGVADISRHVTECRLHQETRVQNMSDD